MDRSSKHGILPLNNEQDLPESSLLIKKTLSVGQLICNKSCNTLYYTAKTLILQIKTDFFQDLTMEKAHVTGKKTLYAGKFLALELLNYQHDDGRILTWESAVRNPSVPAVMILPEIKPDNEIIIIRQFRPPTGRYVWETPAGLIEPGEDPAVAALRELEEETGYTGKLRKILPASFSSSGLSGESVYMAFVEIDGSLYPPERKLETNFDDSESIAAFRIKRSELNRFLLEKVADGDGVDSKLLLFSEMC